MSDGLGRLALPPPGAATSPAERTRTDAGARRSWPGLARPGVDGVVCIGTDDGHLAPGGRPGRRRGGGRSGERRSRRVRAVVGLHPHEASEGVDLAWLGLVARRAGARVVVAVGECGLDYYYEHSPRAAQRDGLRGQIALAHEHDLALVIHARDAWDDLFDVLDAEGVPERTVLHCFTGGPDEARAVPRARACTCRSAAS